MQCAQRENYYLSFNSIFMFSDHSGWNYLRQLWATGGNNPV